MSNQLTTQQTTTISLLTNPAVMGQLDAFANLMAAGTCTVPKHLQGKPSDCMAVVMQAAQWAMNPYAVAQKTHLVNGNLGYEAQLVNAVIQSSGAIVGRFHYEYSGEGANLACRVGAIPTGETEVVFNEWLFSRAVTTKNSPLWKANEKQQLAYLQVKNWARLYCPGAILGVYTPDELEQIPAQPQVERELNPATDKPKAKTLKQTLTANHAQQETERSAATAMPDFDDEPVGDGAPTVFELMLDDLSHCETGEDFKQWLTNAKKQFPDKNSGEYQTLAARYNEVAAAKANK